MTVEGFAFSVLLGSLWPREGKKCLKPISPLSTLFHSPLFQLHLPMFLSVLSLDSAAAPLLQLGRVVYTHKLTPDGRKKREGE